MSRGRRVTRGDAKGIQPHLVGINLSIEMTKVLTRIAKKTFSPYYLNTQGNLRLESHLRAQVTTGEPIDFIYGAGGSFTVFEMMIAAPVRITARLSICTTEPARKPLWLIMRPVYPNDEHELWSFMRWAITARLLNRNVLLRAIRRDDRLRGTNFNEMTILSL